MEQKSRIAGSGKKRLGKSVFSLCFRAMGHLVMKTLQAGSSSDDYRVVAEISLNLLNSLNSSAWKKS